MLIMGVLNVTPDSFSDGGRFCHADRAIAHGLRLVRDGATIVDVGGESTRPGAARVAAEEEARRVLPVVRGLVEQGVQVSIDTMRATTAMAALAAGASFVNDVSAATSDQAMASVVAEAGTQFIASHSLGPADGPGYEGHVLKRVRDDLDRTTERLRAAGIRTENIILDPGLGFSKTAAQNWEIVAGLRDLSIPPIRILVGHSRKRFLSSLLAPGAAAHERDVATAAVSVLTHQAGAWAVRVHDVALTHSFLRLAEEDRRSRSDPSRDRTSTTGECSSQGDSSELTEEQVCIIQNDHSRTSSTTSRTSSSTSITVQ